MDMQQQSSAPSEQSVTTPLARTLPDYDFLTRHERMVAAPPALVWDALHRVRLADMGIARPIVAIRSLGLRRAPRRPLLDDGPVKVLEERPPLYAVGAMIARPWQARPAHREIVSLKDFADFHELGWTKVLTDFELVPTADGGTMLRTQTRGVSTSTAARARFAAYWAVIRPGSSLVRRSMLAAVDRLAVGSLAANPCSGAPDTTGLHPSLRRGERSAHSGLSPVNVQDGGAA